MKLYHAVYFVTLIFGLLLGFTFDGVLVLIVGILLSLVSVWAWHDVVFANVISFITFLLALHFFSTKEGR